MCDDISDSTESSVASALCSAFGKVDDEVQTIAHYSYQGKAPFFFFEAHDWTCNKLNLFNSTGSTACAVVIDENTSNGTRSIVSANVGDSRAILSRNGTAIELTQVKKRHSIVVIADLR